MPPGFLIFFGLGNGVSDKVYMLCPIPQAHGVGAAFCSSGNAISHSENFRKSFVFKSYIKLPLG